MVSYGIVVNSFEELEPEYASDFKKTRNNKVWCLVLLFVNFEKKIVKNLTKFF